jgi:hypothetical protein
MGRACKRNGGKEERIGYWCESQRTLGRPRRKWVDNTKMDVRDIGWGGMDWIDMA